MGRGGVLDLACRYAVDSHVDLDGVRRFADPDYAALSLWMRAGKRPEAVFDRLLARGEIVVHASEVEQVAALARIAAETEAAVVADTREQVGRINGLARQGHSVGFETRSGERIGVGDRVATRRNNPDADVANRESWIVLDVNRMRVELAGQADHRRLPWDYAREHVELAYATTTYGVQGETVSVAHVAIGTHTSAKSAYVGMTRGRDHNIAHLVADSIDDARSQWVQVFSRDRADLGPAHAARRAAEDIERYGPRQVLRPRPPSWAGMDDLTRRPGKPTQTRGIGLEQRRQMKISQCDVSGPGSATGVVTSMCSPSRRETSIFRSVAESSAQTWALDGARCSINTERRTHPCCLAGVVATKWTFIRDETTRDSRRWGKTGW